MRWRRRIPRTSNPLPRPLRRRRFVRRGIFFTLLLLLASALLDRSGVFRYAGDDWRNFDKKTFLVTRVADGDTLTVRSLAGGPETRVRLIGIDAPELNSRSRPGSDHWAHEARHALAMRTKGKLVLLRLDDTETRDRYQRLLAYVYLDTSENLNLAMVREGHAYAHRRYPHGLRRSFEQAEADARRKGRGLWQDVTVDQMPSWRREWLARSGNR